MIGQRYGRLVAIEEMQPRKSLKVFKCICDCGNIIITQRANLRSGHTKSCGCLKKEMIGATAAAFVHGMATGKLSRTYMSWNAMKSRCRDVKNIGYLNYGGRGIVFCERWKKFANFLEDMGERPEGHSLDRIDNDGNYEPSNCKWSTRKEQSNNRRKRSCWKAGYIPKKTR